MRRSRMVHEKRQFFDFDWLPWQSPLRNQKRSPDRSFTNKCLSFGAQTAKIGPADPEIICLRAIVKKRKKTEINASKIYRPVGNLAEWAKKL